LHAKKFFGVQAIADWSGQYYQYANRLAHLYLLRELNKIPTYLIFVYFLNDVEVQGPTSRAEWQDMIRVLHTHLGLQEHHKLSAYVLDVFIDVNELKA